MNTIEPLIDPNKLTLHDKDLFSSLIFFNISLCSMVRLFRYFDGGVSITSVSVAINPSVG